jgi:hypothetical protein
MRESVMRQRAIQYDRDMTDDRAALIRLLAHVEATPHPEGWYARVRRASDIRQAHYMLEWDDDRQEGPDSLRPMRKRLVWSFTLLWIGSVGSALLFGEHAVTVARVILALGLSAVALPISVWGARLATKYTWTITERKHALILERARALPASASNPDPTAAA